MYIFSRIADAMAEGMWLAAGFVYSLCYRLNIAIRGDGDTPTAHLAQPPVPGEDPTRTGDSA